MRKDHNSLKLRIVVSANESKCRSFYTISISRRIRVTLAITHLLSRCFSCSATNNPSLAVPIHPCGTRTTGLGSRKRTPLSDAIISSISKHKHLNFLSIENSSLASSESANLQLNQTTILSGFLDSLGETELQLWATLNFSKANEPTEIWIFHRSNRLRDHNQTHGWEGVSISVKGDVSDGLNSLSWGVNVDALSSDAICNVLQENSQYVIKQVKKKTAVRKVKKKVSSLINNHQYTYSYNSYTSCIPIEGIYGIYHLPRTGPCLVVITKSEPVYSSPFPAYVNLSVSRNSIAQHNTTFSSTSLSHDNITDEYESSQAITESFLQDSPSIIELRRVVEMDIVPIPFTNGRKNFKHLRSSKQRRTEIRQLELLRSAFRNHQLYFVPRRLSNNNLGCLGDVTNTFQRSINFDNDVECFSHGSDLRFFWNYEPISAIMNACRSINKSNKKSGNDSSAQSDKDSAESMFHNMSYGDSKRSEGTLGLLRHFVLICSSMFVGVAMDIPLPSSGTALVSNETISKYCYDEILISRRSRLRAGTRFTKRGADSTGSVANFAETEQILLLKERCDSATMLKNLTQSQQQNYRVKEIYSFVQTRGSIPLKWSSPADVRTYAPKIRIGLDPLEQARCLRSHILEQLQLYSINKKTKVYAEKSFAIGDSSRKRYLHSDDAKIYKLANHKLVFVNLVDKQKDQGRLGRNFDAILDAVLNVHSSVNREIYQGTSIGGDDDGSSLEIEPNSVRHVWFDFHAELKGGKWSELQSLLHDLTPDLERQGYFAAVPYLEENDSIPLSPSIGCVVANLQNGVIRTNCMDCLDRTNVVQSAIGRLILFRQLQERPAKLLSYELTKPNKNMDMATRNIPLPWIVGHRKDPLRLPWVQGELSHRTLWADNADAISRLYAGTAALKGDFTRTGRRTKKGALDDGVNSLTRYYLNNFADVDRQEGIDLMTCSVPFSTVDDTSINLSGGEIHRGRMSLLSQAEHHESWRKVSDRDNINRSNQTSQLYEDLDLRWLPGDLKDLVKELSRIKLSPIYGEIDYRASNYLPWWVISGEGVTQTSTQRTQLSSKRYASNLHTETLPANVNGIMSFTIFILTMRFFTHVATILTSLMFTLACKLNK